MGCSLDNFEGGVKWEVIANLERKQKRVEKRNFHHVLWKWKNS